LKSFNLSRALSEFLIIVAGVLVALGVDGWREGRALQRREVAAVERLAASLDVTRAGLQTTLLWSREIELRGEIVGPWLGVLPGEPPDLPELVLARVVYLSTIIPTADYSDAVFSELQATGDYALIPPELRDAIGAYYSLLARTQSVASNVGPAYADHVRSVLPLDFQLGVREKCMPAGYGPEGDPWIGTEPCDLAYAMEPLRQALRRIREDAEIASTFKLLQHQRSAMQGFLWATMEATSALQDSLRAWTPS